MGGARWEVRDFNPEPRQGIVRPVSVLDGMTQVARETGLSRESLYRALSPKGNPTIKTLTAVLGSVGLKLDVRPVE